jgi:seryl-tRNA synthetase
MFARKSEVTDLKKELRTKGEQITKLADSISSSLEGVVELSKVGKELNNEVGVLRVKANSISHKVDTAISTGDTLRVDVNNLSKAVNKLTDDRVETDIQVSDLKEIVDKLQMQVNSLRSKEKPKHTMEKTVSYKGGLVPAKEIDMYEGTFMKWRKDRTTNTYYVDVQVTPKDESMQPYTLSHSYHPIRQIVNIMGVEFTALNVLSAERFVMAHVEADSSQLSLAPEFELEL